MILLGSQVVVSSLVHVELIFCGFTTSYDNYVTADGYSLNVVYKNQC